MNWYLPLSLFHCTHTHTRKLGRLLFQPKMTATAMTMMIPPRTVYRATQTESGNGWPSHSAGPPMSMRLGLILCVRLVDVCLLRVVLLNFSIDFINFDKANRSFFCTLFLLFSSCVCVQRTPGSFALNLLIRFGILRLRVFVVAFFLSILFSHFLCLLLYSFW